MTNAPTEGTFGMKILGSKVNGANLRGTSFALSGLCQTSGEFVEMVPTSHGPLGNKYLARFFSVLKL